MTDVGTRSGAAGADAALSADSEAVLNALRRVVLALRVWAQEAEGVLRISGAQLFVLQKIAEAREHTVNTLAHATMTSKSSVSVVVTRLVRRGLVKRRPSPDDGRSVILTLTPAGRTVVDRGPDSPQSRVLKALSRLPPSELATFARLFDLFIAEMGLKTLEPRMMFENTTATERRQRRRRGTSAKDFGEES